MEVRLKEDWCFNPGVAWFAMRDARWDINLATLMSCQAVLYD